MWVKIKNDKIPNVILDVPYSAYINSYKRKGFVLLSENNKKQTNNNTEEQGIKLDKEDLDALKEIKEQNGIFEESNKNSITEKENIIDKQIKEIANKKSNDKIVEEVINNKGNKDSSIGYMATRTPIKKTNSKR